MIISELGILVWHFRKLYTKSIIECMESIEESQKVDYISHFNTKSRSFAAYINTYKATEMLVNYFNIDFEPKYVP